MKIAMHENSLVTIPLSSFIDLMDLADKSKKYEVRISHESYTQIIDKHGLAKLIDNAIYHELQLAKIDNAKLRGELDKKSFLFKLRLFLKWLI